MLRSWEWLTLASTPNMLALPELSSATKPRALGLQHASDLVAALTVPGWYISVHPSRASPDIAAQR